MLQTSQADQLSNIRNILSVLEEFQSNNKRQLQTTLTEHDVRQLQDQVSTLSRSIKDVNFQQLFLSTLHFSGRQSRHEQIHQAHSKTLEWALTEGTDAMASKSRFTDWLSGDDGLFWVSGKAGSGKSTFMKHVADNPETKRLLTEWAGPQPIVITSHYFWYAGSDMQKSQEGLLQTLLFEIFRQSPDLIPLVCGSTKSEILNKTKDEKFHWTLDQLRLLLQRLVDQDQLACKICFFIDGLDEFAGDALELTQDLMRLAQTQSIKLCVSSRPLNVFETAFGQVPSRIVYMHELNTEDIREYCRARLTEHPRWMSLLVRDAQATSLIHEITSRADGVFLWVFMVTKNLRDGLNNDDSLADLQRRLNGFSSDLEQFFTTILNSVEPFYHQKMAGALSMTLEALMPLDLLIYHFHDLQYDNEDYAIDMDMSCLDEAQQTDLRNRAMRRINGYCCGLLEPHGEHAVQFLHRTVADFLRTSSMSQFLSDKCKPDFNASLTILRGYTALHKTKRSLSYGSYPDLRDAFRYVVMIQEGEHPALISASIRLVEEVENRMRNGDEGSLEYFLKATVQYRLGHYLEYRLANDPGLLDGLSDPLKLLLTVDLSREMILRSKGAARINKSLLKTLKLLLQNRDLNDARRDASSTNPSESPWADFAQSTLVVSREVVTGQEEINEDDGSFLERLRENVFQLFLDNGADPNRDLKWPHGNEDERWRSSPAWTCLVLNALYREIPPADTVAYFRALDAFFDHGATLPPWRPRICAEDAGEESRFEEDLALDKLDLEGEADSPEELRPANFPLVFFEVLADESLQRHRKPQQQVFLTELVKRLLLRYRDSPYWPPRDDFMTLVETGLGARNCSKIRDDIFGVDRASTADAPSDDALSDDRETSPSTPLPSSPPDCRSFLFPNNMEMMTDHRIQ